MSRRMVARVLAALTLLGAVTVLTGSPASTAGRPVESGQVGTLSVLARTGPFYVKARHSGKCLNVSGASTANGASIIQYTCVAAANNQWYLEQANAGYYRLVAAHSNKCVHISQASIYNGASAIQYPCSDATQNLWYLVPSGGNYNYITAVHSYKCLNVSQNSLVDTTPVIQYPCEPTANNQWILVNV